MVQGNLDGERNASNGIQQRLLIKPSVPITDSMPCACLALNIMTLCHTLHLKMCWRLAGSSHADPGPIVEKPRPALCPNLRDPR